MLRKCYEVDLPVLAILGGANENPGLGRDGV